MKITRIDVYAYDLNYAHGEYRMSGGRNATTQSSTLVRIATDADLDGWGEVCPIGSTYLPAFADGARAGIRLLAPALLGLDPRNVAGINRAMDATLLGHPYAKSPIDIACWDLLGKAAGLSVTALLGGRLSERFPLYFAVPVGDRDEMVAYVAARKAEGIRRFQLKVGGDPAEDVRRIEGVLETLVAGDVAVADANGGWSFQDAVLAVRLLRDVRDLYLEQPCRSMADCVAIRRLTDLPMIYDECVVDVESLYLAVRQGGAGGINLKLSRVGGLSAARIVRDVAVSLGTMLTIEDSWGGDVTTAAVSHLAASTPPELLFTTSFFNDWTNEHVAGHRPRSVEGFGASPDGAGLGIEVDVERLGEPLFSVR